MKERLVGAAVLMAAAVILIPEMLSGPDRERRAPASRAASDTPLKTYTIDLNQPPGTDVTAVDLAGAGVIDERAPPPEETAPMELPPAAESASSTQAKPESGAPAAAETRAAREQPPKVVEQPTQSAKPPTASAPPSTRPAPRELASTPAAPKSQAGSSSAGTSGWAVQIGSFSKQDTAERLSAELRAAGQKAFVMPVQTSSATLYRVRVGPVKDRAGAEALLRRLKARSPGAAVVAHP